MSKVILDKTGATHLLLIPIVAKAFTPELRMLPMEVGSSAWLAIFLGGLVALGGVRLTIVLLNRFPGAGLVSICRLTLGRWIGALVAFSYFAFFTYLTGITGREFASGFHIAVMPRTPISAFMFILLGVALYAAFKGPESLGRMAAYLVPVLTLLLVVIILGTARHFDTNHLFPLFGLGMGRTLRAVLPMSSHYTEILALPALAALIRPEQVKSIGLKVMGSSIIGMTGAWLIVLLVFPYPGITHLFFPMLDLARLVEVSEFLQRLEATFIFLWFFAAAFELALAMVALAILLADLTGLADYRPLLIPIGLLLFAIGFIPHDVIAAVLQGWALRSRAWPMAYGLPVLMLLVAVIRRKRGRQDEESQTGT